MVALLTLTACDRGGSGGGASATAVDAREGTPPGPGFASRAVLISVAEETDRTLAVLSIDEATGEIGACANSPGSLGPPMGRAGAAALDLERRRIFLSLDGAGSVAVLDVDPRGVITQAAGSPFALEIGLEPGALALGAGGRALYVAHPAATAISQLAVDPDAGALAPLGAPLEVGDSVRALATAGDLLFAACAGGTEVRSFRIDPETAALAPLATSGSLAWPPADLEVRGERLYATTAAGVHTFAIDASTGAIEPLSASNGLSRPVAIAGAAHYRGIALHPEGRLLAAATLEPPSVALFDIEADGSLAPRASLTVHAGAAGPKALAWTPDGRYLYVADDDLDGGHEGIWVLELAAGALRAGTPPRYRLPGGPIDLIAAEMRVTP